MRLYYVAHPYGGDRTNLLRAKIWYVWLVERWPHNAYVMNWAIECELTDEGNGERERGIDRALEIVRRCDGFIACGPCLTAGMREEWDGFVTAHPDAKYIACLARMPEDLSLLAREQLGGLLS